MKRLYTHLIPACAVAFVVLMAGFGGGENTDYPVGAPPGYTNSPSDGQNCSHCMGGTAVPLGGLVTSDIPGTGYVKGITYNIIVTATGSGNKGFELSPQDLSGNPLGTLIAGTDSKLVGEGKYITHKLASEDNTMSWSFQWQAPAIGVGPITFYACVVIGQLNTKTTTLIAPQSTLGIDDQKTSHVGIYPNPVVDRLNVSFSTNSSEVVKMEVLSLSGKKGERLYEGIFSAGEHCLSFPIDLGSGIYLLRIEAGGESLIRKVVVQ